MTVGVTTPPIVAAAAGGNTAFILSYKTTVADEVVTLPFSGTNSFDVDWGDGSSTLGFTGNNPTHPYSATGFHTVTITGTATAFGSTSFNTQDKLWDVINWGVMGITNWSHGFRDTNLSNVTATGALDCGTNAFAMFYRTTLLTSMDTTGFDGSALTGAAEMFGGGSTLATSDYDDLLINLSGQTLQTAVALDAWLVNYTAAATAARSILTSAPNSWVINDSGI